MNALLRSRLVLGSRLISRCGICISFEILYRTLDFHTFFPAVQNELSMRFAITRSW